jgi:hypothetical protein
MTDDEMNRKMEFIVEQQAQFAADIQILKERQTAFQGELETLATVASTALETSTRTAEIMTTMAQTMSDAQAKTQRQISRLARLLEAHVREGHPPDVSPT